MPSVAERTWWWCTAGLDGIKSLVQHWASLFSFLQLQCPQLSVCECPPPSLSFANRCGAA